MNFGLICEFRNPERWKRSTFAVYEDIIDHVCEAESLGFRAAEFLEHHFVDDGYLPSPLIAASAVAARTKIMRVATNIALLPLYDPVRFAEDTSVLDALSNGRLDVGVATGYRDVEYSGYRLDLKTRGARMDEAVQIVRRLWQGESVTFDGTFFKLDKVKVTPRPIQSPNPPLWIGGFAKPALRRAARFGDGYTGISDKQNYDDYLQEVEAAGKPRSSARVRGTWTGFFVVSNDPEKTFERLAPHAIYWGNSYASWFEGSDTQVWSTVTDNEGLRASGLLTVLTPTAAIEKIKTICAGVPLETFSFCIAPPGVPVSEIFEHLALFAKEVIPAFSSGPC
jgi:alkanesulfonate monooxygenase SsuD/methylene tetrahydromethanopterin reductase-like flavin-dependent oxidoreductase (luciferase family)